MVSDFLRELTTTHKSFPVRLGKLVSPETGSILDLGKWFIKASKSSVYTHCPQEDSKERKKYCHLQLLYIAGYAAVRESGIQCFRV